MITARLLALSGLLAIMAQHAHAADEHPLAGGTVKVGMNVFATWYSGTMPAYANILLNFSGFNGGSLTADGVPTTNGHWCMYQFSERLCPGMIPTSTDDRATQYMLTYHCDDPDQDSWRHKREYLTFTGFTVAAEPTSDGHGDYTGWLSYDGKSAKDGFIVGVAYATEVCDAKGIAQHPLTRLKIRYPGCVDGDFLTPLFRQRMGGFSRLRFCDAAGMNGRVYNSGIDVPGSSTATRAGQTVACNSPTNVQTQRIGGEQGASWGAGPGHGSPLTFWDGKKWTTFAWGLGCKAPCTLVFPLNKSFLLFMCNPAVDHEVDQGRPGPHGDVTLTAWSTAADHPNDADWTKVKVIEHLHSTSGLASLNFDVTGQTYMKFVCEDNGDPDGHLDLINPRLWRVTQWKDRFPPSSCAQSCGGANLETAYEHLVHMCNELGTDAMFNVPLTADDDYLHNFAHLLLYGSDAQGRVYADAQGHPVNAPLDLAHGRVVYLECDNEVWNWGYSSWQCTNDQAMFHGRPLYSQFALIAKHMSEIFKAEFAAAGHPQCVRFIFSNQLQAEKISQDAFDWLSKENSGKPVSTWFDYYATAPYCPPDPTKVPANSTLDQLFEVTADAIENRLTDARHSAALAKRYGLEATTYEGGSEMSITGDAHMDQMMRKSLNDRRMGRLYDRLLRGWQAAAGENAIFNQYSGIDYARWAGGGQWAVLPYLSAGLPGSVRYDAILRCSHPAGDCDDDGHVTYADFLILKRNFGTGHWWSQGDFDNNGDVGLDDFYLLYANLSKADQQRADVQAFPAEHRGPFILGPAEDQQGGYALVTWMNNPDAATITVEAKEPGAPATWKTPMKFVTVTPPRHGTLDLTSYPKVHYTPTKDYIGIDDCVIAVDDAAGVRSNPEQVWIQVDRDQLNGTFAGCRPKPSPWEWIPDTGIQVPKWMLSKGAGICADKGPFLNGLDAPGGYGAAIYLQGNDSSLSQRLEASAGSYTLSFLTLCRNTSDHVAVKVSVDDVAVTPTPFVVTSTTAWMPVTTPTFTVTSGAHSLAIKVVDGKGDFAAAIAQVMLRPFKPLSAVKADFALEGPQPSRTPIVVTAASEGGVDVEYQFQLDGVVARDYSPSPSWVWMPNAPGTFKLGLKAKDRTGATAESTTEYIVSPPAATIKNGDFRICVPARPPIGGYIYSPLISVPGWTIERGGICADRGPFLNFSAFAPGGAEVAVFLQGGSLSQEVEFSAAGAYQLRFQSLLRSTVDHSDVTVSIDGAVVTPRPLRVISTSEWKTFITPEFTVNPGVHTVTIKAVVGDPNISHVALVPHNPLSGVALAAIPSSPQPAYSPIGLCATPSDGIEVQYRFLVDGAVMQDWSPRESCAWTPTAAGSYHLVVKAKDKTGATATSPEAMTFVVASAPTHALIRNGDFSECLPAAPTSGGYAYSRSLFVPGWTFSGNAGLCGSHGPFVNGLDAPGGTTTAAFIQLQGSSLTQRVYFPAAGSHALAFQALCRNTSASVTIDVTVDGTSILPNPMELSSTEWTGVVTPAFPVTPGLHALAIVVTGGAGTDYAACVGQVTLDERK